MFPVIRMERPQVEETSHISAIYPVAASSTPDSVYAYIVKKNKTKDVTRP